MANKFGKEEVQDTFGDLIAAAGPDGIREAFDGGFELVNFLFKAAEMYPTIKEAVNDFPTFWSEFIDLTPQESLDVIGGLHARFPAPDPVQQKIIDVLENMALTHDYLQDKVFAGAQKLIERWKSV